MFYRNNIFFTSLQKIQSHSQHKRKQSLLHFFSRNHSRLKISEIGAKSKAHCGTTHNKQFSQGENKSGIYLLNVLNRSSSDSTSLLLSLILISQFTVISRLKLVFLITPTFFETSEELWRKMQLNKKIVNTYYYILRSYKLNSS